MVLYIQKININFVIFDSETSTKSCTGNHCPVNYQKLYGKDPSTVNLGSNFFRDNFFDNFEIFRLPMLECFC